jgi:hypothetical protein
LLASGAAVFLLFPSPLEDIFFTGWVLFSVLITVVGLIGSRIHRTYLVWLSAAILIGLSIVGMWSIGFLVTPAALCLILSAALMQVTENHRKIREQIIADPPSVSEAVAKTLVSCIAIGFGSVLVYLGAFARSLFEACARETLTCTLEQIHWDAVSMASLGLASLIFGGWLLRKQIVIARILSSEMSEQNSDG